MTRNDVDEEARVHKADTTPPPEGEDDAYNAPTKVGEVNNQAWAALLAQAAEDAPPASMSKPVSSSVKPTTKPPESKVPADGSNGMPLLYDDEEENDEDSDEAATLLHPNARLARLGRAVDATPVSGETPRSAPPRSSGETPRSAPPRSSGETPRSAPPRSSKDAATMSPPAIPAPIVPHAPAPPSVGARPAAPPRPAPPPPRSGPSLGTSSPPSGVPTAASAPPAPRSGPNVANSSPPSGVSAASTPSARPEEARPAATTSARPPSTSARPNGPNGQSGPNGPNGIVHTPPLATIPPPASQQPPSLPELSSRGEPISLAPGGLLNPVPHPSTFAPAAPKKDYLLLLIGVAAAVGFLTLAVGILLALGRL